MYTIVFVLLFFVSSYEMQRKLEEIKKTHTHTNILNMKIIIEIFTFYLSFCHLSHRMVRKLKCILCAKPYHLAKSTNIQSNRFELIARAQQTKN